MRIVGGSLRGRKLAEPSSDAIRPTTDRVRESLFNILDHRFDGVVEGALVLDLFAGTGALGIESLSRGATFAAFVENSQEGNRLLKQNLDASGLGEAAHIIRQDATRLGAPVSQAPFDLVFADPPYGRQMGESALTNLIEQEWLKPEAIIILEERRGSLPDQIAGMQPLDTRRFGDTELGFYGNRQR